MVDFDRLEREHQANELVLEVLRVGRAIADQLSYGPGFRRAALEHFSDAFRAAQQRNTRPARVWATMATIHAGRAECGHDVSSWYATPRTVTQRAAEDAVAFCDCGTFYEFRTATGAVACNVAAAPRPPGTAPLSLRTR